MLRKSLIAIAATAALATGLAGTAEAKTTINIGFGLGLDGGYYGGGYHDHGWYDDDCHYVTVKHKKVKQNGKVKVWFSKKLVCH